MLKKTIVSVILLCGMIPMLCACSKKPEETAPVPTEQNQETAIVSETETAVSSNVDLPDGIYTVDFNTDSGMFHVNEACDGKGTLTIKDGKMNVHVTLVSKSIVNLFVGTAENAQKEDAALLYPTEDPVTYKDGFKETVFGFDIPIEQLDTEFALAIIGKKGTWYDHTVSVSNPEPIQ